MYNLYSVCAVLQNIINKKRISSDIQCNNKRNCEIKIIIYNIE